MTAPRTPDTDLQELLAQSRTPESGPDNGPASRAALGYLVALIREGLDLDEQESVPDDLPIGDLGVDSLLALEIGDRVQIDTGVVLTAETLADQPTLTQLAQRIAAELPSALPSELPAERV